MNTHSKHSMCDWFNNGDDEKVMPESIIIFKLKINLNKIRLHLTQPMANPIDLDVLYIDR